MVLHVKAKKAEAQKIRKKLNEQRALDHDYPVQSDDAFVYFPVKDAKGLPTVELESVKRAKRHRSLKGALSEALSEKEMGELVRSFDIVGSIAIIEVPPSLEKKKKLIGQAILDTHRNVKTVFRKSGGRKGVYRTISLELLAGEENYETVYTEHGVRMRLDVGKVYFSTRLSEERRRIASLVRDGETIAGLFAGVGPFPLVIASKKRCKVYAVELNPVAADYMRRNIGMNLHHLKGEVIPVEGDVKKVAGELPKCDRVLMPLPKGGEDFLGAALDVCKSGGIVHFYQFAPDKDLYSDALKKIEGAGKRAGRKIKVVSKKVVRPYSPRIRQVVIDFKVE